MKSLTCCMLLARAALSIAADSIVYYPPQQDSSGTPSDIVVHAGDSLNITWTTGYPNVDLQIEAYAADSNFTMTSFYNPDLDASSFFLYELQRHDYEINDTSLPIQAFFLLSDSRDSTQFIRTKNFTIKQPLGPSAPASTFTGSVTIYSSLGTVAAAYPSTASASASASAFTSNSASPTAAGGHTGSSTLPSGTAVPAGLSSGAKAGLGVGITVGVLGLAALIGAAAWILRRKKQQRREAERHEATSSFVPGPHMGEAKAARGGKGMHPSYSVRNGNREYYGGNKADQVLGVGAGRPVQELGQGQGTRGELAATEASGEPSELPASTNYVFLDKNRGGA